MAFVLKTAFLSLLVSGILGSHLKARAAETSVCHNSLQKICKDTESQKKENDKYLAQLNASIEKEAEEKAGPRILKMKAQIPAYRWIKRFVETLKIKNQEIMRAAKSRIAGLETVITNAKNVEKIKSYFHQAIEQSQFSPTTKMLFQDSIKSIIVGNFADYLEKSDLENNVVAQILNNPCGSSGLVANAFATSFKGQRYVLICPGFLITLNQMASEQERFDSVLLALAHEMGHHIDNTKFTNEIYAPYLSCLASNYADSFVQSDKDKKICQSSKADPRSCRNQITISHAAELIADQWGIRVTAVHAKSEKYSIKETEQLLIQSWTKLCGTGDDGVHPSGDFRIQNLMAKSPELGEIMRCDPPADMKPGCSFDGATF